jgi:YesN/AraC family two-component response regulator
LIILAVMSADSSTNTVMKGIKHGACGYLIKPVRMEELRNIWQHVVRKKWSENKDHEHSGSIDDTDRNRPTNNDNEYASSANDVGDDNWKSQKKKREKDDDEEGDENGDPSSTSKKPRVVWSVELHQQFVNAVNHLGIDSKFFTTCPCGSYYDLQVHSKFQYFIVTLCVKGSSGAAIKLLPCGHEVMSSNSGNNLL